MSKAIEFIGRMLPSGAISVPRTVRRELSLNANTSVRVILERSEETVDEAALAAARAAAWRLVDEVRARLSGMDFSLTDAVLETRREEDETL